jgi:membrane protease YdiL (CAAX protease family)
MEISKIMAASAIIVVVSWLIFVVLSLMGEYKFAQIPLSIAAGAALGVSLDIIFHWQITNKEK